MTCECLPKASVSVLYLHAIYKWNLRCYDMMCSQSNNIMYNIAIGLCCMRV